MSIAALSEHAVERLFDKNMAVKWAYTSSCLTTSVQSWCQEFFNDTEVKNDEASGWSPFSCWALFIQRRVEHENEAAY